jgi:hypothetical protein
VSTAFWWHAIDAALTRAVEGAKAEGYSIGYKEGLTRGAAEAVEGERALHAGAPPLGVGSLLHVVCPTCKALRAPGEKVLATPPVVEMKKTAPCRTYTIKGQSFTLHFGECPECQRSPQ